MLHRFKQFWRQCVEYPRGGIVVHLQPTAGPVPDEESPRIQRPSPGLDAGEGGNPDAERPSGRRRYLDQVRHISYEVRRPAAGFRALPLHFKLPFDMTSSCLVL